MKSLAYIKFTKTENIVRSWDDIPPKHFLSETVKLLFLMSLYPSRPTSRFPKILPTEVLLNKFGPGASDLSLCVRRVRDDVP